jgi:predicted AlkP superfamily phosphohydrolase/phosphomutase
VRIFKKEEVYSGPYLESAPDILYHMSKYTQATSIWEEAEWGTTTHSGHHAPRGMFIASGPDIEDSGAKLSGLKIYDITPTILHWFGLPVDRDIDGKVLTEIFRERSAPAEKNVLYRESSEETAKIKLKVKKLKESRHV